MRRSRHQKYSHLTKGSTVEVTSDEEGFKGVWFEATVLGASSPGSKSKEVWVEYKSIVAEENGSELLKEVLHVSFVRPVPPVEKIERFELYDDVDAFHKDGWWTGVVTRVLEDSRYQVTFDNPPDELEFGVSELRFHQKWVKGKWVRPGKQRTGSLMFSVGENVEVSFDSEDRRDAWFPSTVLEHCGNSSFLVESYRRASDKKAIVEKVLVDSFHIRPIPPRIVNKFSLLEKVDALYDYGWWSGVITRELDDSRYIVFFKHTNKEMELNDSDLRPHMDWKDGQWFTNAREVSIPSDSQTKGSNNCNDTGILQKDVPLGKSTIMNDISEERTRHSAKSIEDPNEKPSTDDISLEKTSQKALSSCNAASLQAQELPKDGTETPKASLKACKLSAKPSETPCTKSPADYPSPNSEYAETNILAPVAGDDQPGNHSWKKRTRKNCQELGEEKRETLEKLQGAKFPKRGSKGIAIENAAEITQKLSKRKKADVPIIMGLECTKVRSSRTKRSRQIDNESLEPIGDQKQIDAAIDGIQGTKQLGDGDNTQKRKRGRPARKPISAPTDMGPNGDHSKDESSCPVELAIMVNEDGKEQLEVQLGHTRKRGRTRKMAVTKLSNEKTGQSLFQQHEKHYIKRGKRQTESVNIESQAQGSVDTSGVKTAESNRIASDGEEVFAEYNKLDDQPLAKWFEEMQSPTSADGSRVAPACDTEQCAEMREKQDMPIQTPVSGTPTTQTETQSLPFIKDSDVWSMFETMAIFQKFPQKPHFRPLELCKESKREGLAIGCMVTFSSIAEKTYRLHFDDSRSAIEEKLETLSDLEMHGFEVQPVRDQLTVLLSMKDKKEKLESQAADIGNQIIAHNTDKEKIEREIEENNKQIAELQCKNSVAISKKEVMDREIDSLRSQLEDIQADLKKCT
ncbi:DUF724 domain-containing protein 3-like isoform X1 [Nicotiana sylvestris]|uniref:Uncharacterized protein LOC104211439 isoform X1 n=1 Tax=Nicotiana sylvestris TaxID=4096 RepID=A0A1U7V928_NICSY|nr:PREDICTED: uncharacterized protein LOC104211439 isoform X1 [Nicotiana sylvestris]